MTLSRMPPRTLETPMSDIECFFDCSSPWTYFAFHNLLLMHTVEGLSWGDA